MSERSCKTCGGTGWIYTRKSWFYSDGFTKHRCSICDGSGVSSIRPSTEYADFQAKARDSVTIGDVTANCLENKP